MTIFTTEKSIANLPQIIAPLFILPTLCYVTTNVKRVNKSIEVRAVVRDRR